MIMQRMYSLIKYCVLCTHDLWLNNNLSCVLCCLILMTYLPSYQYTNLFLVDTHYSLPHLCGGKQTSIHSSSRSDHKVSFRVSYTASASSFVFSSFHHTCIPQMRVTHAFIFLVACLITKISAQGNMTITNTNKTNIYHKQYSLLLQYSHTTIPHKQYK
jgi:hypothetical protein